MTSIPEVEPTRSPAPAPRVSVWEDFADIFFAPSSVFERRRDGGFAVAFIVLTIVIGALTWAWMGAMEPAFMEQFNRSLDQVRAQQPGLTEDQIAGMRGMMLTVGKAMAVFTVPLIVLLTGFGIWLIGKLFDSSASFKTALMIGTFAQFPRVLKLVVELVQTRIVDPASLDSLYAVTLSPARFLGPDASMVAQGIAGRFDVFIIWMTVLIGIGVYVAGRTSKRNAALVAILVWLIAGLLAVGSSARGA